MMTLEQMKAGIIHLPVVYEVIAGERRRFGKWAMHDCSMCGYQCGYFVNLDKREGENDVIYDNGCDCGFGRNTRTSSFEDMYSHYSMQSSEGTRTTYEKVFGL